MWAVQQYRGRYVSDAFTFTFTFIHIADAFIQSDFQERALKVHRSLIITTRYPHIQFNHKYWNKICNNYKKITNYTKHVVPFQHC